MPRFKLDENLPAQTASVLRDAGHDTTTVSDQQLAGEADSKVASVCKDEGRVLVTLDLDFADIRLYPPRDYAGIIVLRLARQDKQVVLDAVRRLAPILHEEPLARFLWIVEGNRIRIHG